jgi:hypothetical protein
MKLLTFLAVSCVAEFQVIQGAKNMKFYSDISGPHMDGPREVAQAAHWQLIRQLTGLHARRCSLAGTK